MNVDESGWLRREKDGNVQCGSYYRSVVPTLQFEFVKYILFKISFFTTTMDPKDRSTVTNAHGNLVLLLL